MHALDEFDQEVLDREVDDTPVEVPELLMYQPRDDEPVVEPPTSADEFLLDSLEQARDEYGDFDFSVDIHYYDISSSGDPDTTYRDGPYLQHVPTSILGKVRDQKSWDQGNLPGTSTYTPAHGDNPWFEASPAVDFSGVFTGNGVSAGSTLPIYTPPGSPPAASFGSPSPSSGSSVQQPRTSDAGSNPATESQSNAAASREIIDQTTPNDGAGALNEGVDNLLSPLLEQIHAGESAYTRPFDVNAQPDWKQLAENYSEGDVELVGLVFSGPDDLDDLRLPGTPRVCQINGRTVVVVNNIERLPEAGNSYSRYAPNAGALVVEGLTEAEADFYIVSLTEIAELDERIARLDDTPQPEFDPWDIPMVPLEHHLPYLRDQIIKQLEEAGLTDVRMTGIANGFHWGGGRAEVSAQGIEEGLEAIRAATTVHGKHELGLQNVSNDELMKVSRVGLVVKIPIRAGVAIGSRALQTEVVKRTVAASGHVVRVTGAAAGNVLKGLKLAPRGGFDLSQSVGAARVSSWSSRLEGTRLKQVGNYWIKEVDPNASAFRQWWGRGSLNAQAKALDRLGDLAPSHLYRNGKLVIRDVGEFAGTRGDVFQTWLRGSWRLRTPMNDIRGRNMGANGLIFDPAWHPIEQRAVEGGTIFVIYRGGELIYLMVEGEE